MDDSSPITDRQREVITFIANHLRNNGQRSPTLREIGDALGIASSNAVKNHVDTLVKKGFVATDPRSARSIRLTGQGWEESGVYPPGWETLMVLEDVVQACEKSNVPKSVKEAAKKGRIFLEKQET